MGEKRRPVHVETPGMKAFRERMEALYPKMERRPACDGEHVHWAYRDEKEDVDGGTSTEQ